MIDTTFPLVELHRHLDGSVRLETVLELGLQYGLPLPACRPGRACARLCRLPSQNRA